MSTINPTISGGAVTSWAITPSLPTGLTFGTTNGSIWGTPENVTGNASLFCQFHQQLFSAKLYD